MHIDLMNAIEIQLLDEPVVKIKAIIDESWKMLVVYNN
jgi:hypothetical protein